MTKPTALDQPPITSDEDLATFLRGYEIEAGGALILAMRDGTTTTAQRVAAATRVLDITHGKPSHARQITVADLGKMSQAELNELLVGILRVSDGLPKPIEDLFVELAYELLGVQEEIPPWVPHWGDHRDEAPGGVIYERRLRREKLARTLRFRGAPAPRPPLQRGPGAASSANGAN